MVVGISGKLGSGKTTFADYAVANYGAVKKSFGGVLKAEVADFLQRHGVDNPIPYLYGTQEEKDAEFIFNSSGYTSFLINYGFLRFASPIIGYALEKEQHTFKTTGRHLLQFWGTEYRRQTNPDYWVEALFGQLEDSQELIFIDDVRFPNEADMVKVVGGVMVRIADRSLDPNNSHASETSLDNYPHFDITIRNNRTLKDFLSLCNSACDLIMEAASNDA